MNEKNVTVTIDKAREWYNSGNVSLKELALQAFSENELKFDFKSITSFEKVCEVLDIDYDDIDSVLGEAIMYGCGKSSPAMLKLNLIRKALNLGCNLSLTEDPKNSYIYYPLNPFVTETSTYYRNKLCLGEIKIIGKIKHKEILYNVLGGTAALSRNTGIGCFCSDHKVGYGHFDSGFLGCATKEIAKHFSLYFGMLIIEAKYGDLEDFEIVHSC